MKLRGWVSGIGFFIVLLVLAVSLFSVSAQAAFLYKSYIIRKAGEQDILCDPYIVQKDDYVLKIFRQRGEISNADFPEFLKIFKIINPQVENIDKILPGQNIFIPLKKLEPGSVPDQEFGVVTIPFVTKTEISDLLKDHVDAYEVKRGDTVSKLLSSHFGRYGTKAYNEGLRLFKSMNPQVEDVNLILVGEELLLPRKSLQNEPWYESLFDASGNIEPDSAMETDVSEATAEVTETASEAGENVKEDISVTPLADVALLMDAKLYQKGTYYFPRTGRSDLQLDLTKFPVLETRDGSPVLITSAGEGRSLPTENLSVLKHFWKDLVVADLPRGASPPQVLDALMGSLTGGSISKKRVLNDNGVQVTVATRWMLDRPGQRGSLAITPINGMDEKTPQPAIDYLKTLGIEMKEVVFSNVSDKTDTERETKISYRQVPELDASLDRQVFVRNFFGIIGMEYQQNVTVSFEYVGIKIQVVTNTLNRSDGRLVLIDFGDLQEEAIATLEKAGFELIRVPPRGAVADLIPELFRAAEMTCEKIPTFMAARRSGSDNTSIFVPGFLALKDESPQVLLTTVPIHNDLIRFFIEREIDVVALTNVSDG